MSLETYTRSSTVSFSKLCISTECARLAFGLLTRLHLSLPHRERRSRDWLLAEGTRLDFLLKDWSRLILLISGLTWHKAGRQSRKSATFCWVGWELQREERKWSLKLKERKIKCLECTLMACNSAEQQPTWLWPFSLAWKKRSFPPLTQRIPIPLTFALTLFFCLTARCPLILSHTSLTDQYIKPKNKVSHSSLLWVPGKLLPITCFRHCCVVLLS